MRALLDVNFIIALFDPDHVFHDRAHAWWAANSGNGWASCPLTENGAVRIMSNPAYSQRVQFTPSDLIDKILRFSAQSDHLFWGDGISLCDHTIFASEHIHSSRQITDLYLLALAVVHQGCVVTFDQKFPLSAVHGAKIENLRVV